MNRKQAFTLIELLVVIAIIGMLSAIVLGSLSSARGKARDARRKEDITQIQRALELYYDANGHYPASGGAVNPNNSWSDSGDASWASLQTALSPYLSSLAKDPIDDGLFSSAGHSYAYFDDPSGGYGCGPNQWYMIVYNLENAVGTDPSVTSCDNSLWRYGGTGSNTSVKTVGNRGTH